MTTDKTRERRLRREAKSQGLALRKSRVRTPHLNDRGGYRIVDPDRNWIVAGERYDLDLDGVEAFLTERKDEA